jgi:surfactin synthase thioesterase subunit
MTRWPALREQAVAIARTDLQLCLTDEDADTAPLPCPIHAIGGDEDPLVGEADLHEWRSRTAADFSVQVLNGGHFYVHDRPRLFDALLPLLSTPMADCAA